MFIIVQCFVYDQQKNLKSEMFKHTAITTTLLALTFFFRGRNLTEKKTINTWTELHGVINKNSVTRGTTSNDVVTS